MKQLFTTQDLLLYLYDELDCLESMALQKALKTDVALQTELQQLKNGQAQLADCFLEPEQDILDNILDYSRLSHLETELH
ncbi:hypothetical protein [Saprospira grandis]|uniref:Uncharacterized protein n=1 Tax=Saprospira grandis (strain Lewin) TaxID=984262 RepID=H6L0S5_SAPGL|nr:hypothetical protein [Saprospira grandis]AFC24611.1 hypothetical protein SGRA_1877 [Saprospira grandis str. Lewin]WBM76043.1 hypothetical protein OP864_07360 [Saprospira grandis]